MKKITQEYLKSILDYDPDKGIFTWKLNKGKNPLRGKRAGFLHHLGYRYLHIDGKTYSESHLVWLYMTGSFPKEEIDHIDTIKDNNSWNNLREACHGQNQQNKNISKHNTSNFKGVTWHKRIRKWQARITATDERLHLGYFNCPTAAHLAYCKAAKKLHGEFARFK